MRSAARVSLLSAALAATAGGAAYAMFSPRSQWAGPIAIAPRRPGEVALTFDDGPNPDATPYLLDLLAKHQVRATFFLIGQNVLREPALVRRIASEGHVVGNHSMTHPWLPFLSARQIRAEVRDCAHAIEDTLGTAARLFRPPHGARTPTVLKAAQELGMRSVNWNIIVSDWMPQTAEALAARIGKGIAANERKGFAANVVLHDGGHGAPRIPTVEAVKLLLDTPAWRSLYTLTTLDKWL